MDKQLVVKSNFLVEASYRLSSIEQKLVLTLVTKIKREDQEFNKYSFNLGELAKVLGLNTKSDYDYLREVTKTLLTKVLILKKENSILQTHWLESVEYFDKQQTVTLSFNPDLKPFLLQLKENFTKFQLKYVIQLKSMFSIRAYELLKQYEKIGTREFSLIELRDKLGVLADEYPFYGNFKAKVLLVAQKELRAKTDLSFDFEEIKIGRKVGKIRFQIKIEDMPNFELPGITDQDSVLSEKNQELENLVSLLPKQYRNKVSITKIIKAAFEKYGSDYVVRNLVYANEKSNAVKLGANLLKGSNYRVYLSKALKEDYGIAYQEDQLAKREEEQFKQKTFIDAEKQKRQENVVIDIERENRERAREFIKSFAPETMQKFEEEAQKRMSPDFLKRYQRKDTIGLFEFKRRLEDVVMEHTGIIKVSEKQEQSS